MSSSKVITLLEKLKFLPPQGYLFPQTLTPSLQLAHISISALPFKIFRRKSRYSGCFQISLKDLFFKSPIRCFASLSKQQGTTSPSQVITGECQSRQQ